MSLRTFTVFQDTASTDKSAPKVSQPNALATRSSSLNATSSANAAITTDAVVLNKENYHPVTGERAALAVSKKRKTGALATKLQAAPTTLKTKKDKEEPELKKRKAVAVASTSTKSKKKEGKVVAKKSSSKRTSSRKVSPMPRVKEEDEAEKDSSTQAGIDSKCYELTVQPLADVSEAYEQADLSAGLENPLSSSEDNAKFRTVKAASVEPEIRDYFEPSQALFSATSSRLRAVSEDVSSERTFSTPERKKIYASFTFSSPAAPSIQLDKPSRSISECPTFFN
ncbi:hypothetical protein CVT24_005122 [Panaeolus cyanescens]|uniref:Uncharacterized protein n=1 Tax=Panaeolus cyanescens TaxID=181874 RepID=A0A409W269_9AGAR|nr:hypothetical protein CVT24_005122 [Panaeolus cyanescens]